RAFFPAPAPRRQPHPALSLPPAAPRGAPLPVGSPHPAMGGGRAPVLAPPPPVRRDGAPFLGGIPSRLRGIDPGRPGFHQGLLRLPERQVGQPYRDESGKGRDGGHDRVCQRHVLYPPCREKCSLLPCPACSGMISPAPA